MFYPFSKKNGTTYAQCNTLWLKIQETLPQYEINGMLEDNHYPRMDYYMWILNLITDSCMLLSSAKVYVISTLLQTVSESSATELYTNGLSIKPYVINKNHIRFC